MNKIIIKKNPNGDTRTAQGKVSFDEFQKSNDMHIRDVSNIMNMLADVIKITGENHDWTKKEYEEQFYEEFTESMKNNGDFSDDSKWYQNHIRQERHHINSYVHEDVDLIDVLEMISDCISAGLARSGKVRPIEIDKDVLYKAFENTCKLILNNCELVEN